jgi:hypothetical protein
MNGKKVGNGGSKKKNKTIERASAAKLNDS